MFILYFSIKFPRLLHRYKWQKTVARALNVNDWIMNPFTWMHSGMQPAKAARQAGCIAYNPVPQLHRVCRDYAFEYYNL